MARLQLFELADFGWFPQVWRDLGMDILRLYCVAFHPFDRIVPLLREAMERTGGRTIIDLGSGSGGPVEPVRAQLERDMGAAISAILTDKFPDLAAFGRAAQRSNGRITYRSQPVEAGRVPPDLKGFRTLFNVFHHFEPDAARKVLRDAIGRRQGIGIFEFVERSWVWLIALVFFPLFVWAVTPFLRPFRLTRLLWTYALPVVPLFVMIDGLLSCLRSYSLNELLRLADGTGESYVWECGHTPSLGGSRVTYLIGWPKD